jgi:hypothetical protein
MNLDVDRIRFGELMLEDQRGPSLNDRTLGISCPNYEISFLLLRQKDRQRSAAALTLFRVSRQRMLKLDL